MILELKGSLASESAETLFGQQAAEAAQLLQGARDALMSMGFTLQEADLALKGAPESAETESALLQFALRKLGA